MSPVYKLNIFYTSRDCCYWDDSMGYFLNIKPIYILLPTLSESTNSQELIELKNKFIESIQKLIVKKILNLYRNNESSFSIKKYDDIGVENNFHSILDFVKNNERFIFKRSKGKYWEDFYVEFDQTDNLYGGYNYTLDEINDYMYDQFKMYDIWSEIDYDDDGNVIKNDANNTKDEKDAKDMKIMFNNNNI